MKTLPLSLLLVTTTGAAAFWAGRFTAPHATAPGSVIQTAAGRTLTPAEAAAAAGKTAATVPADAWAALRDKGGHISAEGMNDAIRNILTEASPVQALEEFSKLLKELTPENAEAAFKALRENAQGGDAMRYLPLLAFQWGTIDGKGALAKLKEMGGREAGMSGFSVIGGWASADPQSAQAYVAEAEAAAKAAKNDNETDPEKKREAERLQRSAQMLKMGLVSGLAKSDPAAALALVQGLDERERRPMLDMIAQQQAKAGFDAASAWALSLGDESMKKQALADIMRRFAGQDSDKAKEFIQAHAAEGGLGDAAGRVAREMAAKNPQDAIAWAAKLPAGETQSGAYEDAFRVWGFRDPTASSTYLTTMPAGPAKDAAVASFARSVAREDPQAAIQWAQTISDEKDRQEALVRAVRTWSGQDANAAQAWIASQTNLSAEVQQQMTQPLNRDGGRGEGGRGDFRGFGGGDFGPGFGGPGGGGGGGRGFGGRAGGRGGR